VVLAAQGESAEAKAALEKLCRTYWWPLYGFVRREGYKPEEAQDLTQAFFARLLERKDLETVRQERGRLRSYLLASIKNFLSKARHRELTVKRGAGQPLVSLEDLLARKRTDQELIGDLALTNMGLGDKAAAFALSERAIAADPIEKDALLGAASIAIVARVTAQTGEPDRAIAALEKLLSIPGHDRLISLPLTPALLRLDPMFDPLRNDPRFQKLCEEKQP
jgi:DNA-directed RNA polymerase specialized sigma24 family protein